MRLGLTVGFGLGLTAGLGWFMDVVEFGFWFDDDESGLAWFEFGFWLGLNLDFGLMIMNLKLEKKLERYCPECLVVPIHFIFVISVSNKVQ